MKRNLSSRRSLTGSTRWLTVVLALLVTLAVSPAAFAADPDQRTAARADADYAAGEYRKALKGYLQLAKKGDPFSQYRASYMYLMAEGAERDLAEAYAWAVLAAESEDPQLETYLEEVRSLVPPAQHEEAQGRAEHHLREWGRLALAIEARRKADRRLRECTGSRLGTRCDEIYAMEMPKFWSISPGDGSGTDGGGAAPSGSVSGAVSGAGTATRDAEYYRSLREYAADLDRFIEQNAGSVELGEFEVLETGENAQESPDGR